MAYVISILGIISIWVILLPLVIGLAHYKKLNMESRIIFFVVLAGVIPQLMRPFINTTALNILYNIYTPVEFVLYCSMFIKKTTSGFNQKFFYFSALVFSLVAAWFFVDNGIAKFFIRSLVLLNNILQICWVCVFLMEYYQQEEAVLETGDPFFWFLSGITIYATCTLAVYGLWHIIKGPAAKETQMIKLIHHFFNIILYIFFSIGLLKNRRATKTG